MLTCPCNVHPLTPHFYIVKLGFTGVYLIMPPTLKKLMGHIAFGACVRACVRGCMPACVTLFVPTVTFKPLKLES